MTLRLLIILTTLLFSSSASLAGPPTKKESTLLDAYRLQLSLEEASSLVSTSHWEYERKVLLLEKIVLISCMPHVHRELTYSVERISDKCRADITELLKKDPNNLIGTCAQYGINSQACRNLYTTTYMVVDENQPLEGEKNESTAKDYYVSMVTSSGEKSLNSLSKTAMNATKAYRENRDPKKSFQLYLQTRQAFLHLLPRACEEVHNRILRALPAKAKPITDYPLPKTEEKDDELREEWRKFEKERQDINAEIRRKEQREQKRIRQKTPTKRNKGSSLFEGTIEPNKQPADSRSKYYRVRYIEDECAKAIQLAFWFQKNFPTAICYWEGFSSPNCISAVANESSYIIRQQKNIEALQQKNSSTKPVQGGLATF